MSECYTNVAENVVKIIPLTAETLSIWLSNNTEKCVNWVKSCEFKAESGCFLLVSDEDGQLQCVLLGMKNAEDFWACGDLSQQLPANTYYIENQNNFFIQDQYERFVLAWGLGCYQFNAYTNREACASRLYIDDADLFERMQMMVSSVYLVRDLVNTPAEDMGPEALSQAAQAIADENQALFCELVGEQLLEKNYPTIHRVGRAGNEKPRLIDLRWGDESHTSLTLVGKGVCFDTGGLDIKTAAGMRFMKKDMGGGAHVLGLARMIMQAQLPVRLRVLIPAVYNSVDAKSFYPGDVIVTRSGQSVEVHNTDAEGRLVLCDALTEAVSEEPDYLIDLATLTGAARVALGPDIPAMLCNDDVFAQQVLLAGERVREPIWRLPLYQPYRAYLKSEIADFANSSQIPFAGAITAGLYLQSFVPNHVSWMHFDVTAYNFEPKPGRPVGGEACALRALFSFVEEIAVRTKTS